jgi:hypothetical protein
MTGPMTSSPRRCSRTWQDGRCSDRSQCFIKVDGAVVDRMRAMRRPGERYGEVIPRAVTNWPLILVS